MTRASSASTSIARAPAATARIAALALFLSVAGAPLAARDGWSERTWRVEDELPIAAVTAIDQTPDGYLWLATRNGLVRFDGARFEVLRGTDHLEMPSDRLTTLFTEPSGDLWTTTQSEDLLRLRHGTFRRFDREAGLPDDRVVFWRRGRGGELWLGTRGGAAHCLGDRCRDPTDGRVRDPVLALEPADDGSLWIGTHERGLLRLLPDGTLETFGGDRGLPALDVEALHITADGTLWVGTGRGLARLEGGRLIPATVPGEPNTELVLRLESDRDGNLYAGTASGLFVHHGGRLERRTRYPSYTGAERLVLDTPAGRAVNLGTRVEVDGREIFSSAHPITSLHFDREGTLWVGSDGGGLTRLRPTPITLVGEAEGLPGDNVYPIVEGPPGTLWFGVLGGLARLEGGEMRSWGVEAGLPHFGVWSIAPDGAESAWVGSNGVRRFESGRFTKRGVDPALLDIDVRALLLDRQGALWVGSSGRGLFRRLDGEWRRWTADEGVPPAAIRVLAEDAEGAIWLGTDGAGIARCRADAGCERLSSADGLPSDLVRALWIEESGAVWVGTENRGLVRIEPGDGPLAAARRTFVRRHDGLFDDGIHQIVDDGLGRLWMSTNRGLFWVARAELEAFVAGTLGEVHSVVYTERDGLRSREANGGVQSAGLRASDGRLWFPTQAGAAVIDPRRVRDYLKPPPVVFERIEARSPDGVRTLPPPTPEDGVGRLELRPGERDLTVAYTAPSFVAPERIRFRYRLEGLSSDWTDVGDVRQIALSYLPPGRHRLRVAAANADGVWNLDGAVLDLVLPARFWETRAFPVSLVALALAALGAAGLWRRRVTRLRQRELERRVREQTAELALEKERVEAQAEQLRELDRAKSHFFANVSHELRTPLTLLLGPLLDAERGATDALLEQAPAMRRNAQRLQRMIEQILDLQKVGAGKLRLSLEPIDLRSLVRRVVEAFTPLGERRRVALSADLPDAPVPVRVDLDQLERVLGNLLSNALRFTEPGGVVKVTVMRATDDRLAEIAVADTGCGIPAAALPRLFERFFQVDDSSTRAREGMGIGLALARELTTLHGGAIEVESAVGVGSTFRVTLPLVSAAPAPGEDGRLPARARRETAPVQPAKRRPDPTPADDDEPEIDRPAVLVVDDNGDVRAYLRRILSPRFAVLEAAGGTAALELVRDALPDLVIADVMMPGMDGFALGRTLRDDPMTGGIPLVYLTARAGEEDALEGFAASAVAYLTKPFDAAALVARIDALLAQQRRLRERLRAEWGAPSEPSPVSAESAERVGPFERRLREVAAPHLHDERFGVGELASAVHSTRPTLYRKLKEEGGPSPADLLRELRLERARELLAAGAGNVSEIAYAVGFDTLAGFGKAYRRRYGVAPSAHLNRNL